MTGQHFLIFKLHLLYLFTILGINCYPLDKVNAELPEPEQMDETSYANGTIVGKYTYTGNDGNPIHVKYYADDAGYGVELKSIKVLDTSTEEPAWQATFDTLKPMETPLGMTSELFAPKKIDLKNKDSKRVNPYKIPKSSDYETFYQNEIKAPRQCDKGKVRVYLDKEKRIIRRALDNYQVVKYCDRL